MPDHNNPINALLVLDDNEQMSDGVLSSDDEDEDNSLVSADSFDQIDED
jgi:hypothetical protein